MLNGKSTATLRSVFSNGYHCYYSSGVQVDTFSLDQALYLQWRDVSQLIIEKGESLIHCQFVCTF